MNFYLEEDVQGMNPFLIVKCIDGYYWEVLTDVKGIEQGIVNSLTEKKMNFQISNCERPKE